MRGLTDIKSRVTTAIRFTKHVVEKLTYMGLVNEKDLTIRIYVDIARIAALLAALGYSYVTVDLVAELLGVDGRAAGRILVKMERAKLARKVSRRSYKLLIEFEDDTNIVYKLD